MESKPRQVTHHGNSSNLGFFLEYTFNEKSPIIRKIKSQFVCLPPGLAYQTSGVKQQTVRLHQSHLGSRLLNIFKETEKKRFII